MEKMMAKITVEQNDHDLLIRLDTQLQLVLSELRELKTNTSVRVTELDTRLSAMEKLAIAENLATRVKALETTVADYEQYQISSKDVKEMLAWWKDREAIEKWTSRGINFVVGLLGMISGWLIAINHVLGK